jgi:hypothetical protein
MMGSLLVTRCWPRPTCYAPVAPTPTPRSGASGDWDRLRETWISLDLLARDAHDLERGEETRERLAADHRTALDELVRTGELDAAIADDLQVAFESAAHHVWRANAPITCYEPMPGPDYQVESSSNLARQADLLAEMGARSAIDEATLAQAEAAIERDVAFLSMSLDDQQALIDAVMETSGDGASYPSLAELDLEIPPESVTAARILIELLLGRK